MKPIDALNRIFLKSLATLALMLAASSAAITWGQTQTPMMVLVSGNFQPVGGRDSANQFTLDGGLTFQDAYIVAPDPNYSIFPGAQYISSSANADGFPFQTVHYRRTFELPEGYSSPNLTIFIHADNAATVFLNGAFIGAQVQAEDPVNFQDPAESFSTNYASLSHSGTNVMEFDIRNFNDPTAFAYLAEIRFTPASQVTIDIKPGQTPNSINLGSNGSVPVAILSSATFDATTVDPTTVTLAGAMVALRGKGTPMASVQDVNGDGRADLVVHVSTEALQLSDTDTQATLLGRTTSGVYITGTDSVRIVP